MSLFFATAPATYVAAAYIIFALTMFSYLGILGKRFFKTTRQLAEPRTESDDE